jgi:23S rRNA (guanosine2251-2'-O)-methyltransferase
MSDRDRKPPFRRGGGKPFEKGRKFARPPGHRDREASPDGPVILYGWHTVSAALANPERGIRKLFLTENAARRLSDENIDTRVPPEIVRPNTIDQRLGPDAVHQGLLAEADPLPSPDIDELAQEGIVLVLDQITDPHNVGAIIRSAAAFGTAAVIMPERNSPPSTGTLAKAASGAIERVPLVRVVNLSRALDRLKQAGFWCVGFDAGATTALHAADLSGKVAVVLGAEGEGLRRLTREHCDLMVRIPIGRSVESLNVSNAAAIALYELARPK